MFVVIGLRGGLIYIPFGTEDINARVKNLKLQAKTAIMIMAPRKAKALECVVATKPLPVRRRSSVGVRSEGRASRILFFGGVRCGVPPLRRRVAWVKSTRSTGFWLERRHAL